MNGDRLVDVNVYIDMTLTRAGFENSFNIFEGMNTQISSTNASRAKVKYNRIAARDWSRDNSILY